jgi:hypothetical protein
MHQNLRETDADQILFQITEISGKALFIAGLTPFIFSIESGGIIG